MVLFPHYFNIQHISLFLLLFITRYLILISSPPAMSPGQSRQLSKTYLFFHGKKKKIPNASKNDMFTTTGNDVLLNNHSAHCNQSTVKHMPLVWRCHGLPSHKVPANNFFWKNSPHSKNQGEAERKCTQRYYKKMNHICL